MQQMVYKQAINWISKLSVQGRNGRLGSCFWIYLVSTGPFQVVGEKLSSAGRVKIWRRSDFLLAKIIQLTEGILIAMMAQRVFGMLFLVGRRRATRGNFGAASPSSRAPSFPRIQSGLSWSNWSHNFRLFSTSTSGFEMKNLFTSTASMTQTNRQHSIVQTHKK